MKLSAQVAYNTMIQIIGKAASAALGLAALAIMARYLKQDGFGQYTTVITFITFFAVLSDFGLTLVTAQMASQPQTDQNKLLNNLFSLRFCSAMVFLGLAPLAVFFLPYPLVIKSGVMIAGLAFFFTALSQIFVGWFQKNLTMLAVSLAEVAGKMILLGGIIAARYLKLGLLSFIVIMVISSLASFFIHYRFARRFLKISWQIDWPVWRAIIKKAWPLGVTIFFNLIYLRADALILSFIKSQSDVGIYGAAYKIIDVLTTLPFMFAGLVLPILTVAWAGRDRERFSRLLQKSLDFMFILAVPLIAGAQLAARPAMILIAGENFALAGQVLKILMLAIGFIFIGCLLTHAVIAAGEQKRLIPAYIFTSFSALIGYLVFIPLYSYYGAAWVTVYSEAAVASFAFYVVVKYSGFRLRLNILIKSLIASLIMTLAVYWLINQCNLLLIIFLAALIYLTCLYLIKGISKQDLTSLLS